MADDKLKPRHRWALLALMSLGGEISNPDLRRQGGMSIEQDEREFLIGKGYLTSDKSAPRGAYLHRLTPDGWDWCEHELGSGWSGKNGSADGALYAVLGLVGRYLDRMGQGLGELANKANESAEVQIRAAYRKLASAPGRWVSLTDLRPLVHGFDRSEVDETLRRMDRLPGVHLAPESNRKMLTAADRAAAVSIGGDDSHVITIEES